MEHDFIQTAQSHSHEDEVAFAAIMKELHEKKRILALSESFLKSSMVLAAVDILLAIALSISISINTTPITKYFATDNGIITPIVSLEKPFASEADVIQFAKETLVNGFTTDFMNFRTNLERVHGSFISQGYTDFEKLLGTGLLKKLKENKYFSRANVGTGVIIKSYIENGRFTWEVEAPLEIMFGNSERKVMPNKFSAKVKIIRVSTTSTPKGIKVAQINTYPK